MTDYNKISDILDLLRQMNGEIVTFKGEDAAGVITTTVVVAIGSTAPLLAEAADKLSDAEA